MSRFLKNCCIWNLAGYLKLVFRGPEALWVSQCFILLSFSSCLENPQWWFLNMVMYFIEVFGVWGVQSFLWGKIFWTVAAWAHCFLELKTANRFLRPTSRRRRWGWVGTRTCFVHLNSAVRFLKSSSWLSEELQEQLLSLANSEIPLPSSSNNQETSLQRAQAPSSY